MDDNAIRPTLRLLSPEDTEAIVSEACRVLETVGVLVENDEAVGLLREAGATEAGGRWMIPEAVVRDAVATAPERILVYDRDGEVAMDLGEDRIHFDPGSAAIHLYDLERNGRRDGVTTKDVADLARLVEQLPNYAAQSTALAPGDVPKAV